jgi:hypothetical protein
MAYETPKTDWATDDAIGTDDLNRIEENTRVIVAQQAGTMGDDIESANAISPPATHNVFHVTGNTELRHIGTTGRANGARITLIFDSTISKIANRAASPPENHAAINTIYGNLITIDYPGQALDFVWGGTYWHMVGVKV